MLLETPRKRKLQVYGDPLGDVSLNDPDTIAPSVAQAIGAVFPMAQSMFSSQKKSPSEGAGAGEKSPLGGIMGGGGESGGMGGMMGGGGAGGMMGGDSGGGMDIMSLLQQLMGSGGGGGGGMGGGMGGMMSMFGG